MQRVLGPLLLVSAADAWSVVLDVVSPSKRHIDAMDSYFGHPSYGEELAGGMIFGGDGCDKAKLKVDVESNPVFAEIKNKYFLLLNRGGCSFTDKVLHGQQVGAIAVIVSDSSDEKLIAMSPQNDAAARAVHIPSVMIGKKDGHALAMFQHVKGHVSLSMKWPVLKKRKTVEWSLWAPGFDERTLRFDKHKFDFTKLMSQSVFELYKTIELALCPKAHFTPHYFITRGDKVCRGRAAKTGLPAICHHRCLNSGRYCFPTMDGSGGIEPMKTNVDAVDMLQEDLREICVHKWVRDHNKCGLWWTYMEAFAAAACSQKRGIHENACANGVMGELGIAAEAVQECLEKAGGATLEGPKNNLFEKELEDAEVFDLMGGEQPPMVIINGVLYTGRIDCPLPIRYETCDLLRSLCVAFKDGYQPDACAPKYWTESPAERKQTAAAAATRTRSAMSQLTEKDSNGRTHLITHHHTHTEPPARFFSGGNIKYGAGLLACFLLGGYVFSQRGSRTKVKAGYSKVPTIDGLT